MPNNPLTPQEILTYLQASAQQGYNSPQLPPKYVFATDPVNFAAPAFRLFDAAFISTGIIDPNRLGTGATGAGNLYLADDGTWKAVSGGGGGAVDRIIAGTNISISPIGGTGNVTINATTINPDPTGYGSFYSTQNQPIIAVDIPQIVTFNNTYETNDVSLSSNRIYFAKAGTYQFAYIAQIFNTSNDTEHCQFWIKYNGVDFPNSATHITVQARKSSTEPSEQQMKLILSGTAQNDGDYIELYWQGSSTLLQLSYIAPGVDGPVGSPSVIANIIPIGAQGRDSNLNELNDVTITSPVNNQLLRYNSGIWENWTPNFLTTVPTLAQVTTAGNTTTNAINVGGLTVNTTANAGGIILQQNGTNIGEFRRVGNNNRGALYLINSGTTEILLETGGFSYIRSNGLGIGTATDAGYKLDVNGAIGARQGLTIFSENYLRQEGITAKFSSQLGIFQFDRWQSGPVTAMMVNGWGGYTFMNTALNVGTNSPTITSMLSVYGSMTASSALARGVYFNNTLVAAANNDVLVGLDINPTFTNGAFTGVSNIAIRVTGRYYQNAGSNIGILSKTSNTDVAQFFGTGNYAGIRVIASSTLSAYPFISLNTSSAIGTDGVGTQKSFFQYYGDTLNYTALGYNSNTNVIAYSNSTGNVVIGGGAGFTDAGYKLYVNGNIGLSGNLVPTSGTSTVGTFANRFTDFWGSGLIVGTTFYGDNLQSASGTLYFKDGGGVEKMRMDSSGSFMINGTSRTYGASGGYMFGVKGTTTQAAISIARSTQALDSQGMVLGLDASAGYIILRDNIGLAILTNDDERLRIHADGNVSINTIANAGYKLQVIGNTSFSSGTDTYNYITSTATGSAGTIYTNTYHSFFTGTNYATANSWEVYDLTSSASRIHISGITGNVAINQTYAIYKLDVAGDIRSTTGAYLATTSGFVGIGTMAPASKLDVVGDVNVSGVFAVGGVGGWTGTIFIPTNPPGQQNIHVSGGIITGFD